MAIAFAAFRGSGTDTVSAFSIAIAPTADIVAGRLVIVIAASNPGSGTPAHGISDTDGHTWTLIATGLNGLDSRCSVWMTVTTVTIATTDAITVTDTGMTAGDFVASVLEFTIAAGATIQEVGAEATASGNSTTPSVTKSSMSAVSKLLLGVIWSDGTPVLTQDADYANNTTVTTGTTSGDIGTSFGTRISTVTSDTYDPTIAATRQWGALLLALEEIVSIAHTMAASLAGAGSMATALKRGVLMKSSLAGVASTAPAMKRGVLMKTSLAGVASLAAVIATQLKASLSGAAALSGALRWGAGLRATRTGAGAVAPSMTRGVRLSGSLAGGGAVVAVIKQGHVLRASLAGAGSISAVLTHVVIVIVPSRLRPRIYIHDGATLRRLAQLTEITDINRSYALYEHVRTAQFTIADSEPALAYTKPQDAHVIVIESTEYPHPWVGRIVEREGNRAERTISVTADSYDAILGERVLPPTFTTEAGVAKAFRRIIGQLNGQNRTGVDVGYAQDGLAPPMSLSSARGIEALEKLAEVAGMEWWLSYLVTDGQLAIHANIASERGFDMSRTVALSQPGNWQLDGWRENGKAQAYSMTVIGGEVAVTQAFSARERGVAVRGEEGSRSADVQALIVAAQRSLAFGHAFTGQTSFVAPTQRRDLVLVREELKEAGVTGEAAAALLQKRRLSERLVIGRVYPDVEGEAATSWKHLAPGNVVRVRSANAFIDGYDGLGRVLGVQPMEHQRYMDVVMEIA